MSTLTTLGLLFTLSLSTLVKAEVLSMRAEEFDYYVKISNKKNHPELKKFEFCVASDSAVSGFSQGQTSMQEQCEKALPSSQRNYYNLKKLLSLQSFFNKKSNGRTIIATFLNPIPLAGTLSQGHGTYNLKNAAKLLNAYLLSGKKVILRDDAWRFETKEINKMEKGGKYLFMDLEDFALALETVLDEYNRRYPTLSAQEK